MEKIFVVKSIEALPAVAREVIPLLDEYPVVAFYGPMGVGKTTFIKALCGEMGVDDPVNSPSFAIINEYLTRKGKRIFHFDFYRLKNEEELLDLGYEDYFYSGEVCLLEWPEKIENYLPENCLVLQLQELPDGSREIIARS
jgi:tRNA threonylcarbamoyladenosine biosynthesis protein TsaE